MKNRAFTLLELLVVITIIGILSSIVIVSMSGSTDSATIAKGKAYAQQIHALLGSNAVGIWNFDEGAVDTCSATEDVCDTSGYGNHGTFYGDTHFVDSDIEGYALSFDGTEDYIDCGNDASLNVPTEITIESWVKFSHVIGTQMIISKRAEWSTPSGYSLIFDYTTVNGIEVRGRVNNYARALNAGLIADTWYHIVGILSDNGLKNKIYINGINQTTNVSTSEPLENNTSNLYLGSRPGLNSFFSGLVDDVRIYSEALPSTEIQKHYVQGLERLLARQAITQVEYDQRMEEFIQILSFIR
jgi:prepilin-type N-terminal cleavage/methylation domain-containing protein